MNFGEKMNQTDTTSQGNETQELDRNNITADLSARKEATCSHSFKAYASVLGGFIYMLVSTCCLMRKAHRRLADLCLLRCATLFSDLARSTCRVASHPTSPATTRSISNRPKSFYRPFSSSTCFFLRSEDSARSTSIQRCKFFSRLSDAHCSPLASVSKALAGNGHPGSQYGPAGHLPERLLTLLRSLHWRLWRHQCPHLHGAHPPRLALVPEAGGTGLGPRHLRLWRRLPRLQQRGPCHRQPR